MDKQRIETIIDTSDKLAVLKRQKNISKEKFEANTVLGYAGGLFKVTPELLVYINYLLINGRSSNSVIVDHNNNPIMIDDIKEFQNTCQDRYYHALDVYYTEYKEFERLNQSARSFVSSVSDGKF